MDFFMQDLLRNTLVSIEGNNSDNDNDSDSDESVDSIDDNDGDCWQIPVPDDDDDGIIFSLNAKGKLIVDIITAPSNADVGTSHLSVALVSDNAKILAVARPEVFRRMEDIRKQKDQWDANHGTHNNNDNDINTNKDDLKQEMRDSMLLVANTCRKQQEHRDFRRKMSDIEEEEKEEAEEEPEDEGHNSGGDNNKYK